MVDAELDYMKFKQGKVKEAIERLKGLQKSDNTEDAHIEADDILCELVAIFVAGEVVEEWEKSKRSLWWKMSCGRRKTTRPYRKTYVG